MKIVTESEPVHTIRVTDAEAVFLLNAAAHYHFNMRRRSRMWVRDRFQDMNEVQDGACLALHDHFGKIAEYCPGKR